MTSSAVLRASWDQDPTFQVVAKILYGPDVDLASLADDLGVAKMDPVSSDVHVPEAPKKRKKDQDKLFTRKEQVALVDLAKSWVDCVEAARECGLLTDDGEFSKFDEAAHRREQDGKFAPRSGATKPSEDADHHGMLDLDDKAKDSWRKMPRGAKIGLGIAAAGTLGLGAALASGEAYQGARNASAGLKVITSGLRSTDPLARATYRAVAPTAIRHSGRQLAGAIGTAGISGLLGAKAGKTARIVADEITDANHQTAQKIKSRVRKDWSKWDQEHQREAGAALAGASAGQSTYQGAGYGLKNLVRRQTGHEGPNKERDKVLKPLKREYHMGPYAGEGKPNPTEFYRHYPKELPGAATYRTLAHTHSGKTGLAIGAAATAAGAGAGLYALHNHYGDSHFHKSEVTWSGEFSKVDVDKRQVFGWASVTEVDGRPVVDKQGDYIHPADMENAAYDYVLKSRIGGDMHRRTGWDQVTKSAPLHVSDLIESFVVTPEKIAKMGLPPDSMPTGWWVGFKVHDEPTWQEVKKGNRQGFSIHGMGVRVEKSMDEIDPRFAMLSKAVEVSGDLNEVCANLDTIATVTQDEFFKGVSTRMRMGGTATSQQNAMQAMAMQQATEMLAPQVAQQIAQIQQQQMQQMQAPQYGYQPQQPQQTTAQQGPRQYQSGPQQYAYGQ